MRSRLMLSLGLLVAQVAAMAAPVTWFRPADPGRVPAVVHIGGEAADAMRWSEALRARGFAYADWRAEQYTATAWSDVLGQGKAVDPSRVALIASGSQVAEALHLLATSSPLPRNLRGLVLRIDRDVAGADALSSWPSLLLIYAADRSGARASAFALARRARAAGAQVWVQPMADGADEATVAAWLAALEVKRVRRFEDAEVAALRGQRHDALATALSRIAPKVSGDPLLARVREVDSGQPVDLVLDAQGRIVRVSSVAAVPEFDARGALAAVFGDDDLRLSVGPAVAQPLQHPETGAQVHVLPTTIAGDDGAHSLLMLRHADASYSWLDLHDGRGILALTASTDAADRGRVWWLLMDAADERGSRVLRVSLQPGEPRRGLWWDPSHPGHALDLQPIFGGHSAVFATFDEAGRSRWYLASGRIAQDRFIASKDGLQLMRRDPALSAPKADPRHAARISVDFAIDARHPACARRKATASQLALLSVSDAKGVLNWCIEPVTLPAGLPDADVNGTWYGGANDSGWGLSVVASGEGESQLMSAMLYFHDAEGWPRWAMGAAPAGAAGTALVMNEYAQDCVGCRAPKLTARGLGDLKLRTQGWCAQPELRAAFALGADRSRPFQRDEMALTRLSEARCH